MLKKEKEKAIVMNGYKSLWFYVTILINNFYTHNTKTPTSFIIFIDRLIFIQNLESLPNTQAFNISSILLAM